MNLRSVVRAAGFKPAATSIFFGLALALTLGHCSLHTRPAAPLSPLPYFQLEPGAAWPFQMTHWDYPSRLDTAPLSFTMEQTYRIVSLEPRENSLRILAEPTLTTLFFPEGLISEPDQWIQDAEGIWMVWNPEQKKHSSRGLVLPAQPAPGRSWSATPPGGITLQFRLAAGEGSSATSVPGGTNNPPALELADTLVLTIELSSGGQIYSRQIRLARDLGPVSLETFSDSGLGWRLTDRWRRTDLSPFAPKGTATSF